MSGRPAVAEVVVVVPARDEQHTLPGCLAALAVAARRCPLPVHVVVVLDRCTDASAEVVARHAAGHPGVHAVRSDAGRVGAARHAGARFGLALAGSSTWLASTDADSRVPSSWLVHQLELADRGADLVLGTVELAGPHDDVQHAWNRHYRDGVHADGTHSHVHGANLGVRAGAYLDAGGFDPDAAVHEDVLFSRAVRERPGAVVVTTVAIPVLTSARRRGRTPSGVSADLRQLAGA